METISESSSIIGEDTENSTLWPDSAFFTESCHSNNTSVANDIKRLQNSVCTIQSNVYLDPLGEYLSDILKYMRRAEEKYRPKVGYMEKQNEISCVMRTKLIDWLVEVQDEYTLENESLFLAVSYTDRFLSQMSVARSKLQLLGTTAMFVASKYEEIYPPDADEFAYVTADTYTKDEVILMERLLLKVLGCTLAVPTTNQFLGIFLCVRFFNQFYL